MSFLTRTLAIATFATVSSAPLGGQVVIDAFPGNITSIGGGNGIFGQTFQMPTGNSVLEQFVFGIATQSPDFAYTFRAFLYAWNGTSPYGPALYTSNVRSAQVGDPRFVHELFNTGSLLLDPNQVYVALVQNQKQTGMLGLEMGYAYADIYSGGTAVWSAVGGGGPVLDPTDIPYAQGIFGPGYDMAFTATFSDPVTATPEPATLTFVGTGLAAVLGIARWRARHA